MRPNRPLRLALAAALIVAAADLAPAARGGEPSADYMEGIRRNVAKRRERRARRAQPVGVIQPWPLPASLIIRQTPDVHREVDDLLRLLRGG